MPTPTLTRPGRTRTEGAALELSGVTRHFGPVQALTDVTLDIHHGEVHCILGENGAGKSTLCNLVYGSVPLGEGTMRIAGHPFAPASPAEAMGRGIAMVHQHFSLVPTLTVEENFLLGTRGLRLDRAGLVQRVARIADEFGLEVDLSARVEDLSVGRRQRVEIVKALLPDPAIVLFDEPTGVLGPDEVDGFLRTVRAIARSGTAVVLITHKLHEIRQVADRATILRHGRVVGAGSMSELDDATTVAKMVGTTPDALDPLLAAGLGLDGDGARPRDEPVATTTGAPCLVVEDLVATPPQSGTALDAVSLTVREGRIVGIAGVEGNGQSALVSALSGALPVTSGSIRLGPDDITRSRPADRTARGLAVVPEDRHHEGVITGLSVTDNLLLGHAGRYTRFGLVRRSAMRRAADDRCQRFDVRVPAVDAPMSSLSGGNQQKAVLARELSLDPLRCVVAAYPTRGLDVGAVQAVATHLRSAADRGAGVLVVSGELPELLATCDEIHVAYRGRLLGPVDPRDPTAHAHIARLMTRGDA